MNDTQKIQVKQSKRGTELHSYNHERRRYLHVGTISGDVYEKGNVSILEKPELSICLLPDELDQAEHNGALFLRCLVRGDEPATFSISLADFRKYAKPYSNTWYGSQLRCVTSKFAFSGAIVKRTPRSDNPVKTNGGIVLPFERQLNLFSTFASS